MATMMAVMRTAAVMPTWRLRPRASPRPGSAMMMMSMSPSSSARMSILPTLPTLLLPASPPFPPPPTPTPAPSPASTPTPIPPPLPLPLSPSICPTLPIQRPRPPCLLPR